MNRKEYKRYSREFKLEAVRLAAQGERPKAQIARQLGIRVNQLRKWRLEFEAEERAGPPKRPPNLEEDLGHLKRENARLKEENEILKKAPQVQWVDATPPDLISIWRCVWPEWDSLDYPPSRRRNCGIDGRAASH